MDFYTSVRRLKRNILVYGYKNGVRVEEKINYAPELYVKSENNSNIKSLEGHSLESISFASMSEASEFISKYKNVDNFKIYGNKKYEVSYITDTFKNEIKYDINLIRTFFLDIETISENFFPTAEEANYPISLITVYDTKTELFYTFGLEQKVTQRFIPHREDIVYQGFKTEHELLFAFITFWKSNYPDIITGYNSDGYDIPYIINRTRKILGEKICNQLSPCSLIVERIKKIKKFGRFEDKKFYDIYGLSSLDFMDLYMKNSQGSEESFSLDYISEKNLGEKKVEYEGTLYELYMNDYQTYTEYNIKDVELVYKLEQKLKYIELMIDFTYKSKSPTYNEAQGTVGLWENTIWNYLNDKKTLPEIKGDIEDKDSKYIGAVVRETEVGLFKWVITYDVNSLYPNIIREFNIGIESLVQDIPQELSMFLSEVTEDKLILGELDTSILKKYDMSLTGNGKLYKRGTRSFSSDLMDIFFRERKNYQKLMKNTIDEKDKEYYNFKQYATKILINSYYGGTGTPYFQFYNVDNAEAVTVTGRVIITRLQEKINTYLQTLLKDNKNRIIFGDTDSAGVCLDDLVKIVGVTGKEQTVKFIDKFCKEKLDPLVQEEFNKIYDYLNGNENVFRMEREIISDVSVFLGKKNYFMNVLADGDKFYIDNPKVKMKGVKAIKSDTPTICRKKLQEGLLLFLRNDNNHLIDYVQKFKKEFFNQPPEMIAFPKSTNYIDKYMEAEKSVPIHSRAVINHNKFLKYKQLDHKYRIISEGTKIKFCYLKTPNPLGDNVIGFVGKLPKEFGLDSYIDYKTHWEKGFIKLLSDICEKIGWSLEKTENLEDMF